MSRVVNRLKSCYKKPVERLSLDWLWEIWAKFKISLMQFAALRKRNRFKRYVFPLVIVSLIFFLVIFSPKDYLQIIHTQTISFLLFILIVAISSWYGGLGPGILATFLTATLDYVIFRKEFFPYYPQPEDLTTVLLHMIIGIFISIISEARYEAELQKDEFIGLVTHELKNPLAAIKGFAGLLKQYSKKIKDVKIDRISTEINTQSDRLLELINDLLDVTKIEIGKFSYQEEVFDFDFLVKETINHQRVINKERNIALTGITNRIIKGDRYRISQVITNLITNALKYSPENSPVEVKIKKDKKGVILVVKDYGLGIPKYEQKKIFNQYYRTRSSLKGKVEGLGLGLFISSQIVRQHQGKIWVKNPGNKGSTFYLWLPNQSE